MKSILFIWFFSNSLKKVRFFEQNPALSSPGLLAAVAFGLVRPSPRKAVADTPGCQGGAFLYGAPHLRKTTGPGERGAAPSHPSCRRTRITRGATHRRPQRWPQPDDVGPAPLRWWSLWDAGALASSSSLSRICHNESGSGGGSGSSRRYGDKKEYKKDDNGRERITAQYSVSFFIGEGDEEAATSSLFPNLSELVGLIPRRS